MTNDSLKQMLQDIAMKSGSISFCLTLSSSILTSEMTLAMMLAAYRRCSNPRHLHHAVWLAWPLGFSIAVFEKLGYHGWIIGEMAITIAMTIAMYLLIACK